MANFNEFKCLTPVQPLRGDSLLLTTEPLGVPDILLIDVTIKTPSGFQLANPRMIIINSLLFYHNEAKYKIFKAEYDK